MSATIRLEPLPEPRPPVSPAIRGTVFHKCDDAPTPVLSLVWQRLRPGVDFGDRTRRAARVWNANLNYLASLPGCERILWGHCIGTAEPEVLLLIQWRSVAGWVAFQQSPGIRMLYLAGFGRGNPLHKTICLGPGPRNWGDLDSTAAGKVAEILLFTLDTKIPATSSEELVSSRLLPEAPPVETGCLASYTALAERYASLNPQSAAGRKRADSLPETLVRVSVWEAADYLAAIQARELVGLDRIVAAEASAHVIFAARLELVPPIPATVLMTTPPLPLEHRNPSSFADLLSIPLHRQRGRGPQCLPQEIYYGSRMAEMHEFREPAWGQAKTHVRGSYSWQLFRFTCSPALDERKAITGPADLAVPVASLRRELKAYKDCHAVNLCRTNPDSDSYTFEVLVSWNEREHNPERTEEKQRAAAAVIAALSKVPGIIQLLRTQSFARITTDSRLMPISVRNRDAIYEITSLYIYEEDKDVFETAFRYFPWVGDLNVKLDLMAAIRHPICPLSRCGGYWEEEETPVVRDGRAVAQFNVVTLWRRDLTTPVAWYSELSDRLFAGDYERLGLALDILRQIVVGPAESRFLQVFKHRKE